jgi:hypothetical protein
MMPMRAGRKTREMEKVENPSALRELRRSLPFLG